MKLVDEDGNAPSPAGCHPAVLPCTLQAHENWKQGMELHQPRQAYETRQSTGSPCSLKKMVRRHGNTPYGPWEHWSYSPGRLFNDLPPRS